MWLLISGNAYSRLLVVDNRAVMDMNLLRLWSALKFLGYLMILLVAAIIGVSYYSVIVLTCAPNLLRGGLASLPLILAFHALLILLTWSYFMVVFRDPGAVPRNWGPVVPEENLEAGAGMTSLDHVAPDPLNHAQSVSDVLEIRPVVRYCSQCRNGKPPRCHHCSVCQRCVLKMDHHCVWVVNCVGAGNYKFFLLFLLYTFLETTMDALILLPSFINFFREAKNRSTSPGNLAVTFLAFVLNLAFALSLLCFIVMHASLLSSNTTTIEVYEKRRDVRWAYDLGRKKNFEQVFGQKKSLWFFPLFAKEDLDNIPALQGLEFPTYSNAEA